MREEPYSPKFVSELEKEFLIDKCCKICDSKKYLSVHYIDYNYKNFSTSNLIPLCIDCYNKYIASYPVFSEIALRFLNSKNQIVKKTWGFECVITNSNLYCLKALVFWKGQKFSNHYHKIKDETWYCLKGLMYGKLTYPAGKYIQRLFKEGQTLHIKQLDCHILEAILPSILIEVSTQHFDDDSYRII